MTRGGYEAIIVRTLSVYIGNATQWIHSGAIIKDNLFFIQHWNIYGTNLMNNPNFDLILK